MTERWAKVPECILLGDLSDGAVRLYAVLARYGDSAIPKRATLAEQLRCSVDTIDRRMAELVAIDAVHVEHRYDETGRQTSSEYRLTLGAAPVRRGGRTDAAHGGRVDAAPRKRPSMNEKTKGATPPSPQSVESAPKPKAFDAATRALTKRAWDRRVELGRPAPNPANSKGRPFVSLARILQSLLDSGEDPALVEEAVVAHRSAWTQAALQVTIGKLVERRDRRSPRAEANAESAMRTAHRFATDRVPDALANPLAQLLEAHP